jgi:AcrR family transcriptional regulator
MTKSAVKVGKSDKGQQTIVNILAAAEALVIDEGYHNLTLRKVAGSAGLTIGNLQYYFPSKESLIAAMFDNAIEPYLERFEEILATAGPDPEKQFIALVSLVIRDLNQRSTTKFFPEVWALANHYGHAEEFMDAMYDKYRQVLVDVIREVNPALSGDQSQRLALFISSSIEGHTMFIGHEKPWQQETENIVHMATASFLWLVKSDQVPGSAE